MKQKSPFVLTSREKDKLRDDFLESLVDIDMRDELNDQFIIDWVISTAEIYNLIVCRTVRILELMQYGKNDHLDQSMLNPRYNWPNGFNPMFKNKTFVEEFISKFIPISVSIYNPEINLYSVAVAIIDQIKQRWFEGYYEPTDEDLESVYHNIKEDEEGHLSQSMYY